MSEEPLTREQLELTGCAFRPRRLARTALAYLDRAEAAERERDALAEAFENSPQPMSPEVRAELIATAQEKIDEAVDRFYPYFVITKWRWNGELVTRDMLRQHIACALDSMAADSDQLGSYSGGIRVELDNDGGASLNIAFVDQVCAYYRERKENSDD